MESLPDHHQDLLVYSDTLTGASHLSVSLWTANYPASNEGTAVGKQPRLLAQHEAQARFPFCQPSQVVSSAGSILKNTLPNPFLLPLPLNPQAKVSKRFSLG